MYATHWGLSEPPFGGDVDPTHYMPNPMHDEALARLEYLVDEHRRLGLLLGEPGTGKSLLLSVLCDALSRAGRPVVRLRLTGLHPTEFPWLLASELGLNPREDDPLVRLWRMIADRVAEHRYQQLGTVILLDDVDQASSELTSSILRLAQCDETPGALLTLILAADPRHLVCISPHLLDLAELRIDLEPWDTATITNYLTTSLSRAGCRKSVFAPEAIEQIGRLSRGIPRRVKQLADLALLAGASEGHLSVGASTIEAVHHELCGGFATSGP